MYLVPLKTFICIYSDRGFLTISAINMIRRSCFYFEPDAEVAKIYHLHSLQDSNHFDSNVTDLTTGTKSELRSVCVLSSGIVRESVT